MKDIDFDELDRAVSSVLGQKPPLTNASQPVDDATSTNQPVVEETSASQAQPESASESVAVRSQAPGRPSPTLAAQRRGKFMDVMHPSADMSSQTKPAALPAHIAPDLSPLTSEPIAEESEPPTQKNTVASEPTAELDESQALIGAEPAVAETKGEATEKPEASVSKSDTAVTSGLATEETIEKRDEVVTETGEDETPAELDAPYMPEPVAEFTETAPQPTPFLADTKVDKRPLGGFPEPETAPEDTADEAPKPAPDSDLQSAPTVPLPRELQSDVVEVESAHETADSIPTVQTGPFVAGVAAAADVTEDGRVEGHPLFDTSTYHEPIAAVHEGNVPSWLKWVLGLAICLAIGAGVGFFLFSAGI